MQFQCDSPYLIEKNTVIEHSFEYYRCMELGDSTAAEPDRRSVVNGILDKLNDDLAELVTAVESGGFDHLQADQQVALWQRFERLRNNCRWLITG